MKGRRGEEVSVCSGQKAGHFPFIIFHQVGAGSNPPMTIFNGKKQPSVNVKFQMKYGKWNTENCRTLRLAARFLHPFILSSGCAGL
jgi:hypothetical protein